MKLAYCVVCLGTREHFGGGTRSVHVPEVLDRCPRLTAESEFARHAATPRGRVRS